MEKADGAELGKRVVIARDEAIRRLAERLYVRLEQMDPNSDKAFGELAPLEQEIYLEGVRVVLEDRTLLNRALQ
jgi:hypothetical protein